VLRTNAGGYSDKHQLWQQREQEVKVIFACIHNAGRSQMAAAFFNKYADKSKALAVSAGTDPADAVNDCVLKSMEKVGIDLSGTKPQLLTEELASDANLLVTMGCGEACPFVPGLRREDWPLPDPKGKSESEICEIRDEIKALVVQLLLKLAADEKTVHEVCK
jgi:arsenate reductase